MKSEHFPAQANIQKSHFRKAKLRGRKVVFKLEKRNVSHCGLKGNSSECHGQPQDILSSGHQASAVKAEAQRRVLLCRCISTVFSVALGELPAHSTAQEMLAPIGDHRDQQPRAWW